jgi:glycosyltransferase involved in cell wall biosynthesis
MKIGIDCRLWNETGVGRYIRNLVDQLQKLDKKNEYVLFVLSKDLPQINSQLPSNFHLKTTDVRWHSVEEQVTFPQVLNKEKLDLMHFPYFSVPVLYKRPFVITIHDLIIHQFSTGKASTLPQPVYHVKRFGYKFVLSQAVKNAKEIIVPLNVVKKNVLKTFSLAENKVSVTYEGVDENIYAKNSARLRTNNKDYFLYVGNAYPHKNLESLIDAFVAFRKEVKADVELLLVGKDDYFYKRLKERVKSQHIADVFFHHNVSDEALSVF